MLLELADASREPEQCLVLMAVMEHRLRSEGAKWRHVYKVRGESEANQHPWMHS